jgi:hypothetical protein
VPPGGLPARTVKRVTMRGFVPHLDHLFRQMGEPLSFAPAPSRRTSPRGRKPRPDAFLAAVAVTYEGAYQQGSPRPTAEIGRAFGLSAASARAAVAAARRRGFLTLTQRGRASGHASPQARALAKSYRPMGRLQRLATESRTGGRKRAQV